jgi:tRNA pseudouridine32 synthase/23S rRNA pseudouridine746 synthase
MASILFEDDNLIAVDKPEGMAAVPVRRPDGQSLLEVLAVERNEKLYIVHRIDRDTSGLILFARNEQAHRWLNRQFETRSVSKTYLAVVYGVIDEDQGSIDKPLRRFGSGRVAVDFERGKPSLTEFRVLRRGPLYTLAEAYPHTGRQHQIRVHFYSIGHPVAGDPLYGSPNSDSGVSRLMLHAWRLTLPLPDGRSLSLEAPVPESFKASAQSCGLSAASITEPEPPQSRRV